MRREKTARVGNIPNLGFEKRGCVLRSLHPQICQQLNLRAIIPHLNEQRLLVRIEYEQLRNELFTTEERKNKLIEWLPNKGSDALTRFIACLQKSAEGTGTGHHELAKALEKQIRKVHANRPKPQDKTFSILTCLKGRFIPKTAFSNGNAIQYIHKL